MHCDAHGWRELRPFLAMGGIVLGAGLVLLVLSRPWWCACGRANPISLDAFSDHNSQHLFDPYSLTHLLKGLAYCGLVAWAIPRVPWGWGICLAVGLEAVWELAENSPFVIERYRTHTAARGYEGDEATSFFSQAAFLYLLCTLATAGDQKPVDGQGSAGSLCGRDGTGKPQEPT